jgi:hypothetical protein
MFIRLSGLLLVWLALATLASADVIQSPDAAVANGGGTGAATQAVKVCPLCGRPMPASFNFCSNCGANLQKVRILMMSTTALPDAGAAAGTSATATTTTTASGNGGSTTATASFAAPAAPAPSPPPEQHTSLFGFFFPPKSGSGEQGSALSDKPIPLKLEGFPDRPKPLIEIGVNPFLSPGEIGAGFVSPTGAVWQPEFIVYGTARLAFQTFDDGTHHQITEFASRLDLFGNLYLTPTERILIGFRPLDRQAGPDYSGFRFEPQNGPQNDINAYVTTLFFEGGLASLFPKLDPNGDKGLDYNFSIGRQPFNFQDGIMINDDLDDAIGINRTSAFYLGSSAVRATAIAIIHDLHRNDNLRDDHAALYGLFTTADYAKRTVDFDMAFVSAESRTGGDGFYVGLGSTQRLGLINSTFRVNSSVALDKDTPAVSTGTLLLAQFSLTPPDTKDVAYLDLFWGIDQYASAARGPDLGGPLSSIGLLFAAQGLGNYGAPIGDQADNSVGAAIGYQKFIGGTDRQLTVELGGRIATSDHLHFSRSPSTNPSVDQTGTLTTSSDGTDPDNLDATPEPTPTPSPNSKYANDNEPSAIGLAARYQMRLDQHSVLIFDAFIGFPEDRSTAYGFRTELLLKF